MLIKKYTSDPNLQLSTRIPVPLYEDFNKFCHLELRQMADVVRELIEQWTEKKRKKGK